MNTNSNPRSMAVYIIDSVIYKRQSLRNLFSEHKKNLDTRQGAFLQQLTYGCLRQWGALSAVQNELLQKPIPNKDHLISTLINLGLYQLLATHIADYAIVNESVRQTARWKKPHSKGLVNAILRRVAREKEQWKEKLQEKQIHNIPAWLVKRLRLSEDYFQHYAQRPMMSLRLHDRESYETIVKELSEQFEISDNPLHPQAIILQTPCKVEDIPAFRQGKLSVQDASAMWAASLLQPQNGQRILDACAAPGGKTTHLLELAPLAQVIAIDNDRQRCEKIRDNLNRMRQQAKIIHSDLTDYCSEQLFDQILLDAPCSASGIMHRQPDIAWLRRPDDFRNFAKQQLALLKHSWQLLRPGGRLLYTTCSIAEEENEDNISHFLNETPDAIALPIQVPYSRSDAHGKQRLPDHYGDGFYYALLEKQHI